MFSFRYFDRYTDLRYDISIEPNIPVLDMYRIPVRSPIRWVNFWIKFDWGCIRLHWRIVLSLHYDDAIMGAIASQITSLTIVYSTVYLDADQRKHQSSAALAFVRGTHWGPVNSPHKWPVTRKIFPFDDVIMYHTHGILLVPLRFEWTKLSKQN